MNGEIDMARREFLCAVNRWSRLKKASGSESHPYVLRALGRRERRVKTVVLAAQHRLSEAIGKAEGDPMTRLEELQAEKQSLQRAASEHALNIRECGNGHLRVQYHNVAAEIESRLRGIDREICRASQVEAAWVI